MASGDRGLGFRDTRVRNQRTGKFSARRNRIEATGMQRRAFDQPNDREEAASRRAVFVHGLDRVMGTARGKATAAGRAKHRWQHG